MLYCIKNLVNKPFDFTTLRPLTDVKEFVIFLFVSDNSEFGMFFLFKVFWKISLSSMSDPNLNATYFTIRICFPSSGSHKT